MEANILPVKCRSTIFPKSMLVKFIIGYSILYNVYPIHRCRFPSRSKIQMTSQVQYGSRGFGSRDESAIFLYVSDLHLFKKDDVHESCWTKSIWWPMCGFHGKYHRSQKSHTCIDSMTRIWLLYVTLPTESHSHSGLKIFIEIKFWNKFHILSHIRWSLLDLTQHQSESVAWN